MAESNRVQTLEIGQTFAHYRITERLGAGGMGEVYLATDAKLGRKVALKILLLADTKGTDTILRFEQEARSASALNHPNIAHIYEIGESDGLHFIAMEFIEGISLTDKIGDRPLPITQAVKIGIQIADALDEAHSQGIVHRDIKSGNVMLDRRERVKVLDFGLAKVTQEIASEESTRVKTRPGVIMGTVSYMSPEQALGRETDARTDVWSLGVVLYEMVTGRLPFNADSTTETIQKIVHAQPDAVARFNYDVPLELELMIKKALRKDRDERYNSAHDILVDLRSLSRELNLTESSIAPDSMSTEHRAGESQKTDAHSARTKVFEHTTGTDAATHTTSSAEIIISGMARHKALTAVAGLVALVVLAGAGFGLYSLLKKNEITNPPEPAIKVQRLTGDGKARGAEISPDGKFLAYIRTEGGERSIWIKQIQTNSNIQVLKPGDLDRFDGLVFSPDGNFLYFNAETEAGDEPSIYRVPALGGTPTKILNNAYYVQFSVDGKQVSFARFDFATNETALFVANADGTNQRKIAARTGKEYFDGGAAWSPDGKIVAVTAGDDSLVPNPINAIALIPVSGGNAILLGSRWNVINDIVWHPSGDSLIVVASDNPSSEPQVWEVAHPSGTARRLTNNLNGHYSVSITTDGRSVVTGEVYARTAVWVSPDLKPENAKPIMPATGDTWGISWTPDNKIVYVSDQTGDTEIWIMDADGANAKPLTNDRAWKAVPVVSSDGRYIVFTSYTGAEQLLRIDINGGNPQVLVAGAGPDNPDISPDGKWVIFSTYIDGVMQIMRVPIEGGEPQPLTDYRATEPRYSRDGTRFACFIPNEKTQNWTRLAIVPADGGPPIKIFDAPRNVNIGRGPIWTPDDKGITLIVAPGELQNLWLQPVDGSQGKMMTNFQLPGVARREYSRDGKRIALVRGEGFGNAIMITDFR